ncbi:peptide chain release factor 2 [Tolypothrix sp. NIES-4075]|nr:peptide chain release factor 2 [Tolypothrix sp. NIES-4075]
MRIVFEIPYLASRIQNLNQLIDKQTFWKNPTSAHQTLEKIKSLIHDRQEQYQRSHFLLEDIKAAVELLELLDDEQLLQEAQTNLSQVWEELDKVEIRQLLSDTCEKNQAFITITADLSSVDAQAWALMLFRMYYLWAISHGYKVFPVDINKPDEPNIKYALEITGYYAYGYLKSEQGRHARILRISPFNGNGRRYTSFTNVEVSPILDESVEFEIPEKNLEIILPPPQGNVNRRAVWVGVFHLPTGITVFCNNERNQLQNKDKALAILKSKLWVIMQAQGVNQIAKIKPKEITSLSSNPVREYVLHPYQKVKDLRTNLETTAVAEVLDGEIDLFIKAYVQQNNS